MSFSAVDILRGVETIAEAAAASTKVNPILSQAIAGVGAGAGLAADIIEASHDAVVTITVFRSILPGYLASKQRVHDYIEKLAQQGHA